MTADPLSRRTIRSSNGLAASTTCLLSLLAAAPLHAAEWKHEIAPYAWGAAMSGTTAVGPLAVDVGYEVLDRLTVFGGLRYNDLSVNIKTTGPLGVRSDSADEDWIDPVIGAHYTIGLGGNDKWSFTLRGDIGGFGVGSDFAWQGIGTLRWQASERIGVLGAYRYITMDYENDDRSRTFKYDMSMSGPALGVVFTL